MPESTEQTVRRYVSDHGGTVKVSRFDGGQMIGISYPRHASTWREEYGDPDVWVRIANHILPEDNPAEQGAY